MLKYEINTKNIKTENVKIDLSYYNISDISNPIYSDKDILYCYLNSPISLKENDHITIVKNVYLNNDDEELYRNKIIEETNVLKVNETDNLFTCLIDRYSSLSIKKIINNKTNNKYTFIFDSPHFFDKTSNNIDLYIKLGKNSNIVENINLYKYDRYIAKDGRPRNDINWLSTDFIEIDRFIKCSVNNDIKASPIAYYKSKNFDSYIGSEDSKNGSILFNKESLNIPNCAKYIIISCKKYNIINYKITYIDNDLINGEFLVLENCNYVDNYTLETYINNKMYVEYINSDNYKTIPIYRRNIIHDNLNTFSLYTKKIFTTLNIPFTNIFNTDIYKESNINDFINDEKEKSINKIIEMEKQPYCPIVLSNNGYTDVEKIKINIHFRQHRGDNWQCDIDSYWNGVDSNSLEFIDNYFSYENKSNQSDLVYYADFSDLDIKYQKNKLKKSFLRLTFYDSKDPSNQRLLAYSTVFINSGKLYSKYMEHYYDYPYSKIKEKDIIGKGMLISLNDDKSNVEYIDDINWNTSDYIEINENDIIIVNNGISNTIDDNIIFSLYNENKLFIKYYYYDIDKEITVDKGCKYIRICYPVNNSNITYIKSKQNGRIIWKPFKYNYIFENKLIGIRNDREPYGELISYNDKYGNNIKYDEDTIEKYRLSTQFIIEDKYKSESSSEGFYIYLWKDNDSVLPKDLYMKIEYNNAEYGRTIPLMMPFKLENENLDSSKDWRGIKSFEEIMSDWKKDKNPGYSVTKYLEYSYIKLKYKFDIKHNKYVYYLDNELYGDSSINNNNEIILNLYEAKII